MNFEERRKWESTRAKGMLRFVLLSGAVKFGGALFLTISVLGNLLFRRRWVAEDLVSEGVVCLFGGLVAGICIWLINEKRYWHLP
jgi:hypothetical protein